MIKPRGHWFALAAVVAALAAGCSNDDSSGTSTGGGEGSPSGVVSIMGAGGDLFEVLEESWWGPLEEQTDLTIRATAPVDFTKLQSQVESGNVNLDIAYIAAADQYQQAINEGLIEKLDVDLLQKYMTKYKAGDLKTDFLPGSIGTHGVWDAPYGTILVFDEREFPASGPQPDSLDDLWNTKEFPGKRCLNNTAMYNLDIALSADGVPASELYPLDVDRALEKLDEIKPEVAKFWSEGTEPIQLVSSGECVMSTVWNGRPLAAEVVQGIDFLDVAWDKGILDTSWVAIPKGAPNREGAYAALAYFLRPDVGAAIANGIGYPGGNKAISKSVNPKAKKYLATEPENLEAMTEHDPPWWIENGAATEEEFAEWLAR